MIQKNVEQSLILVFLFFILRYHLLKVFLQSCWVCSTFYLFKLENWPEKKIGYLDLSATFNIIDSSLLKTVFSFGFHHTAFFCSVTLSQCPLPVFPPLPKLHTEFLRAHLVQHLLVFSLCNLSLGKLSHTHDLFFILNFTVYI